MELLRAETIWTTMSKWIFMDGPLEAHICHHGTRGAAQCSLAHSCLWLQQERDMGGISSAMVNTTNISNMRNEACWTRTNILEYPRHFARIHTFRWLLCYLKIKKNCSTRDRNIWYIIRIYIYIYGITIIQFMYDTI